MSQMGSKSVVAVMSAARPLFPQEQTFAGTHSGRFVPRKRHMRRSKQHHYSITSSASSTNESGIVSPIVLEALRLTISS
jgi:hypothetical protein